jgi:hypothetical protein
MADIETKAYHLTKICLTIFIVVFIALVVSTTHYAILHIDEPLDIEIKKVPCYDKHNNEIEGLICEEKSLELDFFNKEHEKLFVIWLLITTIIFFNLYIIERHGGL